MNKKYPVQQVLPVAAKRAIFAFNVNQITNELNKAKARKKALDSLLIH